MGKDFLVTLIYLCLMASCNGIITSLHALKRMLERSISDTDIEKVIANGEIIKEYADDKPYPSCLIFKMIGTIPVHVVMAKNELGECIVITVYVPDNDIWYEDFKTKKVKP